MTASTVRFPLSSAAYTDISGGAAQVYFILDFRRQSYNAIRLALGQSVPAPDTVHYQLIEPGRFQVGSAEYPQEVPVRIELGEGDAVYVRADREPLELVVHRQGAV